MCRVTRPRDREFLSRQLGTGKPTAISGPQIVETSREKGYGGSSENVFYKSVSPAADMVDVNRRLTDRTRNKI
jgi:hypothetical protein